MCVCVCVSSPYVLFRLSTLSVCLSVGPFPTLNPVCLFVCGSFSNCQPCLSVCLSAFFFHLPPSSLFSSKTCHLVVDWAAHELGALFVLGNLRKRLKSVHEGCQVRAVGQAVWHHQLVLIEELVHVKVREGERGAGEPLPATDERFKLLKHCRQPFQVCFL